MALRDRIKVVTLKRVVWAPNIEMQIAYKKFMLKSEKDLEDARYLQRLFSIPEENINKYKMVLEEHGRF